MIVALSLIALVALTIAVSERNFRKTLPARMRAPRPRRTPILLAAPVISTPVPHLPLTRHLTAPVRMTPAY